MFLLLCPFVATFFYPEYEEYMKNFYDICVKDRMPKSFEEIILCYFLVLPFVCIKFAYINRSHCSEIISIRLIRTSLRQALLGIK